MNKKKAKEIAFGGAVTYGQLQSLIDNCDRTKPCKINKSLTRDQALNIMQHGIKDKSPDDRPNTTSFNRRNILALNRDGLNVMNILIECSD